jgi:hypothetical protein
MYSARRTVARPPQVRLSATELPGVAIQRHDADRGADFSTRQMAQFGQLCDEGGQGVRSNALDSPEQSIKFSVVALDQMCQFRIGLVQTTLEEVDGSFNVCSSAAWRGAQTLPLSDEHAAQLAPSQQLCLQGFESLIGQGLYEPLQIIALEQGSERIEPALEHRSSRSWPECPWPWRSHELAED